ncbi:MFS transporter [Variovorax boronicumulans]|uniref:MFS transporter n=1 Tax=Variovorax boronicumulans TaxID=436515 RepID=UPI001C584A94
MSAPSSSSSSAARNWLLAAVCLAALGMPLSFTGPAVVLPAIHAALGGSPVQLNWVTNAFMLSFGATLLAAGALADAFGRKRVFLLGLAVVALSCSMLTWAPGIVAFDLVRALQGLGSAAGFAAGTAALAQVFDGPARTRAFSLIGTSFGVGLSCGSILSGWLAQTFGWQAVMLSPGAVSLLALCIAAPGMRESRNPQAQGLDLPGALSFTAALSLLTLGVLQAPDSGWGSPWVLSALAAAALTGAAFVAIERRVAHPMLDLSLFRFPRFVGVQLLAAAPAYGFVVLLVLLPLRFIGLEGRSALEAGGFMFALSGPILVVPTLAAWLAQRHSAGVLSALGLLMCAAGLFWLSRCAPGTPLQGMVGPLLLIGAGIGLPWGLMDGLAVSVVPRERAGMASGIFNTVRVAGEGIALALVGAGLTALVARQLGHVPGHAAQAASQAAQRVTTGDLSQALALLPGLGRAELLQAYGAAFATLLCVLAAVTVLTALAVFAFLRDEQQPCAAAASASTA